MRKYYLVSMAGYVITTCNSYRPDPPEVTDEQVRRGWRWVPEGDVEPAMIKEWLYGG